MSDDAAARRRFDREAARGGTLVLGVDEVGRGCLAGPVVSAAVALRADADLPGVDDSKALSPPERERQAAAIRGASRVVTISFMRPARIDATDIRQATLASMRAAVERALRLLRARGEFASAERTLVLVDGNDRIPQLAIPQRAVIGGDARSLAIAAASIVAKTVRDAFMVRLAQEWPEYGFERHKGYGTPEHLAAIDRVGPCPWHRFSFQPLRQPSLF